MHTAILDVFWSSTRSSASLVHFRGLQPLHNSEYRVSWASKLKITNWLWSFMHEQNDPSLIPLPLLFPVKRNASNCWTVSGSALQNLLFWSFLISPGAPPQGLYKTTPIHDSALCCRAPPLQRAPSVQNPHGKKMLLEFDIEIVLQMRTQKRKPQDRASCMGMGRVYQKGRLEAIILQNQEWHLVAGDRKQVRAFALQGQGMWRCPTEK